MPEKLKILFMIALVAGLVTAATLFATNYASLSLFLLCLALTLVLIFAVLPLLRAAARWIAKNKRLSLLLAAGGLVLLLSCGVVFAFISLNGSKPNPTGAPPGVRHIYIVKEYHATFQPVDLTRGIFTINQSAVYDERIETLTSSGTTVKVLKDQRMDLPPLQVQSVSRGWFIREIYLAPLQDSRLSDLSRSTICCPAINTVQLKNFPRAVFFQARYISKPVVVPYLDTETVWWTNPSLEDGITFSYINPPFNQMRGMVDPLINLTSQPNWGFGLFGILLGSVIGSFAKSMLEDIVKDKLKHLWERLRGKKTSQVDDGPGTTLPTR